MENKSNKNQDLQTSTGEELAVLTMSAYCTVPVVVCLIIFGVFGNILVCVAISTNRYQLFYFIFNPFISKYQMLNV